VWGAALPRGLFSGDEGIKLAQIQGLDDSGFRDGALLYRGQASDPTNVLHPLKYPGFTYEVDGRLYGTYTLVYPVLATPIYRVAGFAWVWLLSLAGLALMLIATARIAVRVTGDQRIATSAVLGVGFATSASLYGCTIFEHTLAGGCLLSAIAILLGPVTARRAFAIGALFAASIALRTELCAFGPSLALLCVWRYRKQWAAYAWTTAGTVVIVAGFIGFNLALSHAWHPTLTASRDAAAGSLAERACHLVAASLGGWGYAAVWVTCGLAIAALVVQRWARAVTAIIVIATLLWTVMTVCGIASMGVRPLVGLFTTAPIVVLALGATSRTRVLAAATVVFIAIVVLLPKHGAIGGLELGPRYLIPVVPLLVIVALDAARSRVRIACAAMLAIAGAAALVANARAQSKIRALGAHVVEVAEQANADVVISDVWWVSQLAIPAQADRIVLVSNSGDRDVWRDLYDRDKRRVLVLRGNPPNPGPRMVFQLQACPTCLDEPRLDPHVYELVQLGMRVVRRTP
jgi:hypothetical protein